MINDVTGTKTISDVNVEENLLKGLKILPKEWQIELIKRSLKKLENYPKVIKITYPSIKLREAVIKFDLNKNNDEYTIRKVEHITGRGVVEVLEFKHIREFEKEFGKIVANSGILREIMEENNVNIDDYNKVFKLGTTLQGNVLIIRI